MISQKLLSYLLIGSGATFLLSAIISGLRLQNILPGLVRSKWLQLVGLMAFFFCGHLLFAYLLWHDFAFPEITIAASIFFGGTFALFLVAHTKVAAKKIIEGEIKFSEANKNLKLKDDRLSLAIESRSRTKQELKRTTNLYLKDLFEMMAEVLANRDQYTFDHAIHVAYISRKIGEIMNLPDEELAVLELGCLVHDIGKTAIPDDVLLKPDRFDYQDRNIMDYHPLIGAKLISRHILDDRITEIIMSHHERLDGSGYPFGLKGKEIGLLPRIVAVADIYDALISRRPYKTALTRKQALAVVEDEANGGCLDKKIVRILKRVSRLNNMPDTNRQVTAGFMKDIELFRRRSYFKEPLTDFYNYRYLLTLDDAGLLKKKKLSFDLILIRFPNYSSFQLDIGYAVADQILDELGHKLLQASQGFSSKRENYDGSVMMFRKSIDYLIYSEREVADHRSLLLDEVTLILREYEKDWNLQFYIYWHQFDPGTSIVQAICQLFSQTARKVAEKNSPF